VGEEPDRIRAEIEQTRAEMSDTVDALGYKADVKSRAKDNLREKRESAKGSIMGVKDRIVGAGDSVSERTPSGEDVKRQARQAGSVAQENPLGLALGSIAVGFLAGMLIPATRVEDEKLGPIADDVKERAMETGQEALEHGKQVAQDAAQSAQQTVKESGQEHAQQVKETAQQHGQEAMGEAQRHASDAAGSPS
jgi:ElaB/YqjD/DUF883 family membrane-anchored ribosome-binding protein